MYTTVYMRRVLKEVTRLIDTENYDWESAYKQARNIVDEQMQNEDPQLKLKEVENVQLQ